MNALIKDALKAFLKELVFSDTLSETEAIKICKHFIIPELGGLELQKMTTKIATAFTNVIATHNDCNTAVNALNFLTLFLNWAETKEEYSFKNPIRVIRFYRHRNT